MLFVLSLESLLITNSKGNMSLHALLLSEAEISFNIFFSEGGQSKSKYKQIRQNYYNC